MRKDMLFLFLAILILTDILAGCSLIPANTDTPIATLPPTLTLPVAFAATPIPTLTSTDTPQAVCTPPPCASDESYSCPGECPGDCGTICATNTPTAFQPSESNASTQTFASIRFAVIGDYGLAGDPEADVAALVKGWQPDFIITTGDNNYPNGAAETIDENIGQYYQEYIYPYKGEFGEGANLNRFFPTLGNHDWTTAQAQAYLDYFKLPGNERYYDFVWGPVHFFALNSDSREPDGVGSSSTQAQWLQTRLAASPAPWKIVYTHVPPYSSTSEEIIDWMRWPFQEWGADVVIAGHDHFYERLEVDGLPYIVNGLGGGAIYAFGETHPGSQVRYNADYGAMLVEATDKEIIFTFQTRGGEIIDTYFLSDAPIEPEADLPSVQAFPNPADYQWTPIVSGLNSPVGMAHAGDNTNRLFIIEQPGTIRVLQEGQLLPTPFLDIHSKVGSQGNEQGLLGLAFHPNYKQNGTFFINYTNLDGNTVVSRLQVSADPNIADPATETPILRVQQPYDNHNGGHIAFGSDGYLFIGMGDGGSAGDPEGNAQNPSTLLGKMLRIDVESSSPYAIPADNPFINGEGLPEILAWGLRNPWKFSFDRKTGDLYIADVGQNRWEEVNFVESPAPGGANFGWDFWEGFHPFEGQPAESSNYVFPIWEYSHELGCSATGGVVYRGAIPEWQGIYLYGDFCSGRVWGLLRDVNGTWQNTQLFQTDYNITAFGEDEAGGVYLVARTGSIYKLTEK